ncbi:DUF5615 family PIN-like protein [Candidatus Margulisiibacteriota bacterium]
MGKTEQILEEAGFSTITLKELGKSSASNGEVINLAKEHNAILLTNDQDFSNILLYPLGSHHGIIILKITPETENAVHSLLITALKENKPVSLYHSLLIVDKNKYRLRHKQKNNSAF